MRLQQLIIKKIDDFGGIEKLTLELERNREMTQEKKWFDNMIIFFNNLYLQEMDVETFSLDYKQASLDTIAFLKEFNVERDSATTKFLINLIKFKLDHISNLRKIS